MNQIFAKRLHELRKTKGKYYTQTKIAKQIGKLCGKQISQTTYTTWENGRSIPDIRTLAAIADYFNVSIDYLFGREVKESKQRVKSAVVMDRVEEFLADKPMSDQEYYVNILQAFIIETEKRDDRKQKQYFKDQLTRYSDLITQLDFLTEVSDEIKGPVRMEILIKLANEWHKKNNFENAISCYAEALKIHDDYKYGEAYVPETLKELGVIYCKIGQFTRGLEYFKKSLRVTKDEQLKARLVMNIGNVYFQLGDYTNALEYFERAKTAFENQNLDEYSISFNISKIYYFMGKIDKSIEYGRIALRKSRRGENKYHEAIILQGLGDCKRFVGFYEEAMELFTEAMEMFKELDASVEQIMVKQAMATLFNDMGDYRKAAELLEETVSFSEKFNNRKELVEGMIELGRSYRNMGNTDKAKQIHEKALDNSFELKSTFLEIEIRNNLALDYLYLNSIDEAVEEASEALTKSVSINDPYLQYKSYAVLGKVFARKREIEKAYQYYQKSVGIIKDMRENILDEPSIQAYIKRKDIQEIYKETSKLLKKMGSPQ